jgi:ubiquitin-conjugating enzyme E2 A
MSSQAEKRLIRDLKKLTSEQEDSINASPEENNLFVWTAYIEGPEKTIWEGGLFELKLDFPQDYPSKPPSVKFISKIFHPNVYNDGRICLDILQNQWSPIYDVWAILTSIRSLLADPNPNSPANSEAAQLFNSNKTLYEQKVLEVVDLSMM